PTPPFWLAMARMRQAFGPSSEASGTGKALHLEDAPIGVASARDRVAGEAPPLARFGELDLHPAALHEETGRAARQVGFGEVQQPHEPGDGAGGDDVGLE